MTLGERIKKAREAKGLTLKDVAFKVGVKEPTIQRYESGEIKNPPHQKLLKLAKALGVDINYLMDWNDDGQNYFEPSNNLHTNEDLEDIIRIYKLLEKPQRYQLMAKAYELEKEMRKGNG